MLVPFVVTVSTAGPSRRRPLSAPSLGNIDWCLRRSVFKQFLHADALNNPPVTAEQAAVAAPVPKAPTQAHALVAAEDDLAADPADGKVEDGRVAGRAAQAGRASQGLGRIGGGPVAESAREGGETRRREGEKRMW